MEDKVVLLTGAASGIGAATARRLASLGYKKLALLDLNTKALSDIAKECKSLGADDVFEVECNLLDTKATEEVVPKVVAKFGKLDCLINNAGAGSMSQSLFGDEPLETAKRLMDLNFFAGYILAQKALPHLEKTKGNIVWTSSLVADKPFPLQSSYAPTKGAIECLSRNIALEYGPKGVRSNTVKPGSIVTPMAAKAMHQSIDEIRETFSQFGVLGKAGEPEDVAKVITFLADHSNSWVTGASYEVNGGQVMKM